MMNHIIADDGPISPPVSINRRVDERINPSIPPTIIPIFSVINIKGSVNININARMLPIPPKISVGSCAILKILVSIISPLLKISVIIVKFSKLAGIVQSKTPDEEVTTLEQTD